MSIIELMDPNHNLLDLIQKLEERIAKLEEENIETANCLYELQNQLDMMNENEYTLRNYTLGQ